MIMHERNHRSVCGYIQNAVFLSSKESTPKIEDKLKMLKCFFLRNIKITKTNNILGSI